MSEGEAATDWRSAARGVRAAFVFLTRLPVGGQPFTGAEWTWAPAHFPLVGAVIGVLLGAVHVCLRPLGSLCDATFVVGASMLLTGALHEDGLADTSDALGGAFERSAIFAILKDSRIGTFGACALLVSVVARVTLLARLGPAAPAALVVVGCAARVPPVWQLVTLPYRTGEGAKSRDVARAGIAQAIVATGWLAVVGCAAVALRGIPAGRLVVLGLASAATGALTGWRYVRRAGGVTGDFLGATEQLCEMAGFCVLAWDGG